MNTRQGRAPAIRLLCGLGVAVAGTWWVGEALAAPSRRSVTVAVDTTKENGRAWDALGGLPDLALCYTGDEGKTCLPGGKSSVTPGEPASCQDSLTCVFALEVRGTEVLLEILDVDLTANDPVGAGLCKVGGSCRIGSATVTFR